MKYHRILNVRNKNVEIGTEMIHLDQTKPRREITIRFDQEHLDNGDVLALDDESQNWLYLHGPVYHHLPPLAHLKDNKTVQIWKSEVHGTGPGTTIILTVTDYDAVP